MRACALLFVGFALAGCSSLADLDLPSGQVALDGSLDGEERAPIETPPDQGTPDGGRFCQVVTAAFACFDFDGPGEPSGQGWSSLHRGLATVSGATQPWLFRYDNVVVEKG